MVLFQVKVVFRSVDDLIALLSKQYEIRFQHSRCQMLYFSF